MGMEHFHKVTIVFFVSNDENASILIHHLKQERSCYVLHLKTAHDARKAMRQMAKGAHCAAYEALFDLSYGDIA